MKKYYYFVVLALIAETSLARPLPPLGKRKYLLDAKRPEIPASIEGINNPASDVGSAHDGDSKLSVMKDPIPLDGKSKKEPKPWKEPERVISKASQLKFQKVAVAGRYSVPRINFAKERKAVEHAEQPVKQDYKKKVQESEDILKDLNWCVAS